MVAGIREPMDSQTVTLTANVSGVASSTVYLSGEVLGITATPGSGMTSCVLTITSDTAGVILNGVTVSAATFYKPRVSATTNDGSTAITNSFIPYIVGGSATVAIASGVSAKTLTVTVYYR
jgi:hypothetical protein